VEKNEIVLLCAGWKGRLALEDMLLAGNIIYNLCDAQLSDDANDGAKVAFGLYEKYSDDIKSVIFQSNHAQRLKDVVGTDDIDYCCQTDITDQLPILHDGIIST